jgi:hypothetical protein
MAKGNDRSAKDKQRASYLKDQGEERTSGKCAVCYKTIPVDSSKSRYSHKCGVRQDD